MKLMSNDDESSQPLDLVVHLYLLSSNVIISIRTHFILSFADHKLGALQVYGFEDFSVDGLCILL